jgi:hypothetical protein
MAQEEGFRLPEGWTKERTNTAFAIAKAFIENNKRSGEIADGKSFQFIE